MRNKKASKSTPGPTGLSVNRTEMHVLEISSPRDQERLDFD